MGWCYVIFVAWLYNGQSYFGTRDIAWSNHARESSGCAWKLIVSIESPQQRNLKSSNPWTFGRVDRTDESGERIRWGSVSSVGLVKNEFAGLYKMSGT